MANQHGKSLLKIGQWRFVETEGKQLLQHLRGSLFGRASAILFFFLWNWHVCSCGFRSFCELFMLLCVRLSVVFRLSFEFSLAVVGDTLCIRLAALGLSGMAFGLPRNCHWNVIWQP